MLSVSEHNRFAYWNCVQSYGAGQLHRHILNSLVIEDDYLIVNVLPILRIS